MSKGKNYLWAFVPFVFMFITTMAALINTVILSFQNLTTGKIIADILAVILFICALILAWEGWHIRRLDPWTVELVCTERPGQRAEEVQR